MKYIREGVRKVGNEYFIDYNTNELNDIIDVVEPQLYYSNFLDNDYWFGYEFKNNIDSMERANFLKWIKGQLDNKPSDRQIKQLVARSLQSLNKVVPLSSFKCVIYPRSNRNNLTNLIIETIGDMVQSNTKYETYNLIKSLPKDITFDWDKFDAEYEGEIGDYRYKQIRKHVDNILIPGIHNLDYFSIAENVKPKYRKYLNNYFIFEDNNQLEDFKHLQSPNILIIDDINTTGSTLKEILRVINSLNPDATNYIYTLIGRE